jgi:hypothetical protein
MLKRRGGRLIPIQDPFGMVMTASVDRLVVPIRAYARPTVPQDGSAALLAPEHTCSSPLTDTRERLEAAAAIPLPEDDDDDEYVVAAAPASAQSTATQRQNGGCYYGSWIGGIKRAIMSKWLPLMPAVG